MAGFCGRELNQGVQFAPMGSVAAAQGSQVDIGSFSYHCVDPWVHFRNQQDDFGPSALAQSPRIAIARYPQCALGKGEQFALGQGKQFTSGQSVRLALGQNPASAFGKLQNLALQKQQDFQLPRVTCLPEAAFGQHPKLAFGKLQDFALPSLSDLGNSAPGKVKTTAQKLAHTDPYNYLDRCSKIRDSKFSQKYDHDVLAQHSIMNAMKHKRVEWVEGSDVLRVLPKMQYAFVYGVIRDFFENDWAIDFNDRELIISHVCTKHKIKKNPGNKFHPGQVVGGVAWNPRHDNYTMRFRKYLATTSMLPTLRRRHCGQKSYAWECSAAWTVPKLMLSEACNAKISKNPKLFNCKT